MRRRLNVLVVLCGSLPLTQHIGAQSSAGGTADLSAARRDALAAYDAGQVAEARAALLKLAPRLPHDFAVQEALGLLLAEQGDNAASLPHFEAAASAQPRNAAAQANLGAAWFAQKEYARAIPVLRVAVSLEPKDAATQANLGRALYFASKPKDAAVVLARASALTPEDADLVYDEVQALADSSQMTAALAVLSRTPDSMRNATMESLWGDVAERAGQYQEAEQHLQRAAQLDPTEPHLYALTVELLRHWTWGAAQQVAEFAMSRYPESRRLRFAKGVAFYGDSKFAQAADVFAALVQSDPHDVSSGDLLGRSCAALGGTESASCKDLIPLARQHPDNAHLAAYAAITILHGPENSQNLPIAEELLHTSLQHDPSNAEAWYQLGVLYQQRQQWAESEAPLRKAITLRPAYAEAHYRLSRALAHLGQKDAAAQELALQQRYAQEEKDSADAQLKGVTVFLTDKK